MSLLVVLLVLAAIGAIASAAATYLSVGSRPVTADFLSLQGVTMRRMEELAHEGATDTARARELGDSLAGVGVGDYTENDLAREHVDSVIAQLEELELKLTGAVPPQSDAPKQS